MDRAERVDPRAPELARPSERSGVGHETVRRGLELLVAGGLLLVLLPVLFVLAFGIRLTSRGPAFFRHERVGLGGKRFQCIKFRTMVEDAPAWLSRDSKLEARYRQGGFKLPTRSDPRVTPFGAVLRASHLDELPQLWNVLKGEMALVGPRPVVPAEVAEFGEGAALLLSVRPGIFGAWTALGGNRPGYPERARIELEYVRTRSLRGDLLLLFRNLPVLARGQGEV